MAKLKTVYHCSDCGVQASQWAGRCGVCGAWNSLVEGVNSRPRSSSWQGYAGAVQQQQPVKLSSVDLSDALRYSTGLAELDRVLGGGVVAGSVILLGGDPGIGKSTLLLQALAHLSKDHAVLYITGEESLQQVSLRAKRLSLSAQDCQLLAATEVEAILHCAEKNKPQMMVIDSIQTIHTAALGSAPGSVAQVRESTARLVQFAKQHGCVVFLVGHVTKEGMLAGPRVLEHMVDAVLYFESDGGQRWRMIRAVKNRFGAANELGIFAMTDGGLRQVSNPSAMLISRDAEVKAGSLVTVTWEGTRPLLIEVQALVDGSHLAQPRRVMVGIEHNRMAMLLAVLHRHAGTASYDQDVFINIVGGVKVSETGLDLALLLAVVSSLKNVPIAHDWVVFGEVGLAGELRPVQSGQERLREAAKHGFKRALVPMANAPKKAPKGMQVVAVKQLAAALDAVFNS
jgi:DNA repair protein RadA/Sms